MAQNIYDSPGFFGAYSRLLRSVRGLDGAPEWPAIRALLPDLEGRRVVDLGCGFGWFCRWASERGAASVLGLDLSSNMLARAKTDSRGHAIEFATMDLDRLELPAASFDLAYSSLALHYVEDLARLAGTVYRALVPDAHFVFSMEHPIFTAAAAPGWSADNTGHRSWLLNRYGIEGPRTAEWLAHGVTKYHRTVGTILNALIEAGFRIRHVEDWRPTVEQVAANPALTEELQRPMFLLVSAQR